MNSLVYFYSKFTEEFLLLSATGVFTLLSIYCYHWVIQKRRLGIASSQIPSIVVKSYLSQLINEAEFVRKQLFGMTDGHTYAPTEGFHSGANFTASAPAAEGNQPISPDLLARVNSLESSLKDKESLVVNINIEKTKLLEEIEKLKANPVAAPSAPAGNQDQLSQKIKNLEARLEEYALFEEDLANLKRLQQENTQLKKKLSEVGTNSEPAIAAPVAAAPVAAPAPVVVEPTPVVEKAILSAVPDIAPEVPTPAALGEPPHALDQDAIDKLLNGTSAVEPVTAPSDQFENLVDSVENSLEIPVAVEPVVAQPKAEPVPEEPIIVPASAVVAAANAPQATLVAGPGAEPASALANKTDEELLKEFENLLNS